MLPGFVFLGDLLEFLLEILELIDFHRELVEICCAALFPLIQNRVLTLKKLVLGDQVRLKLLVLILFILNLVQGSPQRFRAHAVDILLIRKLDSGDFPH